LKGDIPHEFSKLNLVKFNVGNNKLGGPLITEIGLMSHLEELRINDNHLSGEIPTELGKLVHLNQLHMNGNEFTGTLPSELSGLVTLGELHILMVLYRYCTSLLTSPSLDAYRLSDTGKQSI
jgi:Leucine-rich repeat (LRR) protein